MKRFVFGSFCVCLLLLSSALLPIVKADAHPAQMPGVQAHLTSSPIGLQRLKDLVRKTLGQQAVDHMGHRVTRPLATHSSPQLGLSLHQTRAALHPFSQEQYGDSSTIAGYITNAEGVSWVQGVVGFYNVAPPTLPAAVVDTAVAVANSDGSAEINIGVDQTEQVAYLSFAGGLNWTLFHVSANDQIDSEIYLDTNTNQWLLFIEDLTSRQSFGNEFSYTTTLTRAVWGTQVDRGGPVPSMFFITFTNAQWLSNWAGWQPISGSAAATFFQVTLTAPFGGIIWPTELASSGTSFSLIPCPGCS